MLSCTTAQIDYVTSLPLYTTSTLQICRSKCTNICFTTLVVRYIISLTKVHGLPQSFNAPDGCCCSFAKYGTGSILCDAWNSKACGRTTGTSYSTAPSFSHGRSLFQDGPNCHPSDPIHDTLQRWWRVQWGKRNQRTGSNHPVLYDLWHPLSFFMLQLSFQEWTQQMRDMLDARKRGDFAFKDKDFKTAIDCYSQVGNVLIVHESPY